MSMPSKCVYAGSGTVRPERRSADSSRRSPYCSGAPQWTWKRPLVSMPPMSMHSIGHAWAHWKHVSHLSVPYSSYRSCSRPRNLGATSATSSGQRIVALGEKNLRSVRLMPRTRPIPGMAVISCLRRVDRHGDDDRGGGEEQVEQRGGQQPLPGEAHQVVDPDARQRGPHPDEDEHEGEGL